MKKSIAITGLVAMLGCATPTMQANTPVVADHNAYTCQNLERMMIRQAEGHLLIQYDRNHDGTGDVLMVYQVAQDETGQIVGELVHAREDLNMDGQYDPTEIIYRKNGAI
jgi:hypothetical protein